MLSSLYHVLEVTRGLVVAVRWQRLEGEASSVPLYIYLSGQVGPGLGLAQGTEQGRVAENSAGCVDEHRTRKKRKDVTSQNTTKL